MMVLGISHPPKGLRGRWGTYVKVNLLPRLPASWCMALRRGSIHPACWEPCRFGWCSLEQLRSFTLPFVIYTRSCSPKGSFVGEVLFPCTHVTWDPRASSSYSWELSSTKTKRRKVRKAGRPHVLAEVRLASEP